VRLRADQQLFVTYLVLIAVLTLTMSFGAESLLRRHLLRAVEDDVRRELDLGRAIYDMSPAASADSVAAMLGRLSGRRVTLVDAAGGVLGESAERPTVAEPPSDYRARPEIRGALETGRGRAIRRSETLATDHLYLASRTARGEVIRFAVPLVEINRAIRDVQRAIFGVGLLGVVLAGLFSFGFSLLVTRPMRRMSEVARAIAGGDLARRIRLGREDELGELANALNTLAEELQRRLLQLEGERAEMQALIDSMSEGVLALSPAGTLRRANPAARRIFSLGQGTEGSPPERVSRRPDFLRLVADALGGRSVPARELTAEGRSLLATAHPLPQGGAVMVFLDISELRRLEGVRRDFVANASHELKTPLTAIRGYSETLLDPELSPDLIRRFARVIKSNSDRLQRIVDDLLDLSRIESGQWRIDPSPIDLEALVRDVWAAQFRESEALPELAIEIPEDRAMVQADLGAMQQVFSNLIGNSIRYSSEGGRITVAAGPIASAPDGRRPADPEHWTAVEVRDTGSGIPAQHLSRIFERFYRVDPARSREEGGTGLGLAIVKNLVEAHGGWVEAESDVGHGTTIRLILPRDPLALP